MSNGNESEIEVPEEKAAFNEVLKKFRIGVKGDFYETITDDIATTGGEFVFEKPELLMKKLSDWHSHIDAPTRRKIIDYWFAKKGTPVPEEVVKEAGMSEAEKKIEKEKKAEDEKREAAESKKYVVDSESGAITVAKKDDRPALDWEEALKLSKRIKDEAGDKSGEEPPFIIGSEGGWQLNPKAKIGGMELLAFEAVRKSQERGEPLDPFEVMKERAKDVEMIRSVFVGGGGGGRVLDSMEDLIKLKTLLGADEDTKALLSGIYKRLEGGEGKGPSEEVRGLTDRVDKLVAEIQQKELEKRDDQIARITTELSNLRGEIARQGEKGKATDEYGIMSEGLRVFDHRLGAIESAIQGAFGRRPPPLGAGEKKALTEVISEEAKSEQELDQLADKVFYHS